MSDTNIQLASTDQAPAALANIRASHMPTVSRAVVYNALENALSLSQDAPDTLKLAGVIQRPGVRAVSEEPCIDTYLVADDGQAYFTQSTGIGRSVETMLSLYGGELTGMIVQVTNQAIGGGRTIKRLKILQEPVA